MSFENSLSGSMKLAHVLFMDIVGYSRLPIDEQASVLHTLQGLVRDSNEVQRARAVDQLTSIPTGDGMALVFFNDPTAPVKCALEISKELKNHPEIQIRMGIHSGPVNQIIDVNERMNVAGAGINMAQRVMDSGDAGHILVSKRVAEDLSQYTRWQPLLHDLSEVEVKHAVRVHLYNLYTDEVGNPVPPATVKKRKKRRIAPIAIAAGIVAVLIPIALFVFFKTRGASNPGRPSKPEADYRVLLQQKADAWANTVFAAQGTDGGIKMSPSSADATTQVWQTAQCLVGVLSLNRNFEADAPKLKNAFAYIEQLHRTNSPEGWNLYGNSSEYTITEIASWVVLAKVNSLDGKTTIWSEQEKPQIIKQIVRDLDEISRRQDSAGGWRPIRDDNPEFTRTYTTAMALWALIEARRSPATRDAVGSRYDENVRKGVNWLLRTYASAQGWVPNPNRSGQREHFEGLTAQVLFVLSRIAEVDAFTFIHNDNVYRAARQDFLKNRQFAEWSIEANNSHLPDPDLRFVGTEFLGEGSTFLWFPWTLIELTVLAGDETLAQSDRQTAGQLRLDIFNQNSDKLERYVESANLMYVLGENLYAVSVYLNENHKNATP